MNIPNLDNKPLVKSAVMSETIQSISKSLLLLLGPYNYIVCRNCHRKQDLHGTSCIHCGHRLRVEIVEKDALSFHRSISTAPDSIVINNKSNINNTNHDNLSINNRKKKSNYSKTLSTSSSMPSILRHDNNLPLNILTDERAPST